VVVVVGALATGGVAGAATGHLPGPVRDAARTIIGATGNGTPSNSTPPGQPPAPSTRIAGAGGAGPQGSRPGEATGLGPGATGAGPAAGPALEGLCQAFTTGSGGEQGGKLDATAFTALAKAAASEDEDNITAWCEDLLDESQASKKPKEPKDINQPKEPEQPDQSGTGGQGQGGPPASTGGGQGQGGPPPEQQRGP
jgi:hypothetical protein